MFESSLSHRNLSAPSSSGTITFISTKPGKILCRLKHQGFCDVLKHVVSIQKVRGFAGRAGRFPYPGELAGSNNFWGSRDLGAVQARHLQVSLLRDIEIESPLRQDSCALKSHCCDYKGSNFKGSRWNERHPCLQTQDRPCHSWNLSGRLGLLKPNCRCFQIGQGFTSVRGLLHVEAIASDFIQGHGWA